MNLLVFGIPEKYCGCHSQTPYRWANKTFTNPAWDLNPEPSDILLFHSSFRTQNIIYIISFLTFIPFEKNSSNKFTLLLLFRACIYITNQPSKYHTLLHISRRNMKIQIPIFALNLA